MTDERMRTKNCSECGAELHPDVASNPIDAEGEHTVARCRGILKARVTDLRRELAQAYANNHERNVALDALHFVWCDGGCSSGVHRYDERPELVTEELVEEAERNTRRLRTWWENRQVRMQRKAKREGAD